MANIIEIIAKFRDEVSGKLKEMTGNLGELGDGTEELEKTGSKSFGDFMDNVAIAMLGINQAIEVGMKVAEAAKRVYDATVGKAVDVAGEIEELMRVSGDAPETLSALRLEAEKAAVPFDDLYKAMQNLNKNGIAPTVDNLVAIADEYVNLKDPLEKAKLLTEQFGSAGDEIAPMLEAIAGGVEAVQGAMPLFTEEDIQNADNYTEALANFEIAKEGFLVKLGQTFLPSITEVLQNLSGVPTEYAKLYDSVIASLDKALTTGAIKWDTYKYILNDVNSVTGTYSEQVDKLNTHLGFLSDMTGDSTAATEEATAATDELGRANLDLVNAQIAANEATALAAANFQNLNDTGVRAVKAIALEMASLEEQLANANLELAVQVRTFREDIGGQLYDMLRNAGLEGEELELRIATLDAVLGTTFGKEYALELAIDDLFQQLLTDPAGFAESFSSFESAFFPLQQSAQEAITKVMDLQAQLDALVGEYNATINITTNGSIPNIGGGGGGGGGGDVSIPGFWASGGVINAAAGVAAGLSHYWVGERGPEPFFPAMDGRIVSNTQAMAALRGGAGVNSREIANAVREGVKDAMRETKAGNVYNLTMPTSNNPADVRTAFELMEAWA